MVLKIDHETIKFQKVTCGVTFYDVIQVVSRKIHHQNDVTKIFHFQARPLAKS